MKFFKLEKTSGSHLVQIHAWLDQLAQGCIQSGFECLQGQGFHSLSEQLVSVAFCPTMQYGRR